MCTNCDEVQQAVHAPHGTAISPPRCNSSSHSEKLPAAMVFPLTEPA
jgi:hypothetical protein